MFHAGYASCQHAESIFIDIIPLNIHENYLHQHKIQLNNHGQG